jgi:hypothetical protein
MLVALLISCLRSPIVAVSGSVMLATPLGPRTRSLMVDSYIGVVVAESRGVEVKGIDAVTAASGPESVKTLDPGFR